MYQSLGIELSYQSHLCVFMDSRGIRYTFQDIMHAYKNHGNMVVHIGSSCATTTKTMARIPLHNVPTRVSENIFIGTLSK